MPLIMIRVIFKEIILDTVAMQIFTCQFLQKCTQHELTISKRWASKTFSQVEGLNIEY